MARPCGGPSTSSYTTSRDVPNGTAGVAQVVPIAHSERRVSGEWPPAVLLAVTGHEVSAEVGGLILAGTSMRLPRMDTTAPSVRDEWTESGS